ncbi:MAG TPA: hypothetical protein VLH09_02415, partial [Bryobacteraceae bacterium]|nr:hypothetical protein [Bryobacteraceae bacterium]
MGSLAIRRSEWTLIVYFAYVAALARILPARDPVPAVTLWLNLTIIAAYFLLAYADSLRRRPLLGVLRDWYPLPLIMLAYREMGWLAPATHSHELERIWV